MTRQIAPRSVLYRCDRKPLAETIVHSNGAVYTSLIDLTLYLLYMVRGFFVLLDPPAKIQLKLVVESSFLVLGLFGPNFLLAVFSGGKGWDHLVLGLIGPKIWHDH